MSLRLRELGDNPTPPELVAAVLARLAREDLRCDRVLEPCCGSGRFIAGLLALPTPPHEIIGIEIQPDHCSRARSLSLPASRDTHVAIIQADIFSLDLRALPWTSDAPLLVLGNPPWVTSAELGTPRGPRRQNDGTAGLAALTGASNFDLAEAVWLKVLSQLSPVVAALLCKLETARRVLEAAARRGLPATGAFACRIDGARWFGVSAESCLLVIDARGHTPGWAERIPLYASLEQTTPETYMGCGPGGWVSDLDAHATWAHLEGRSPLAWRQGVKHDAAAVMELRRDGVRLVNGLGEEVDVERSHRFPLLKATALHHGHLTARRETVLTQRHLSDPTDALTTAAPRLWAYLERHRPRLDARRSRIYNGRPPFAMFGVGPYSFSPYKLAVSGLHRAARFRALGPQDGRPVLVDDTCYAAPLDTPAQAALLEAVFDSEPVRRLLDSLAPIGAKRPITQARLQRIDPAAALRAQDWPTLRDRAARTLARIAGAAREEEEIDGARDWILTA